MKTFLRENKERLFLLAIPILCLIVIWNVNIYKIWYDYAPWVNLGSPPAKAGVILRIDFPSSFFKESIPIVYVYAYDRKTYYYSSMTWAEEVHTYSVFDLGKSNKLACANKIEQEWELKKEDLISATEVVAQGLCSSYGYQYAVYQIKQDGSVWRKHINSERLDYFRLEFSFFVCLSIIVYILVWTVFFNKTDPLELKQYYDIKSFFRENKGKLILVLAPILCLAILWSVNIYKIWYDNTPWIEISSPPSKVVKIHYVMFPYSPDRLPELNVYAEDKKVHHMNRMGQWDSAHRPDYLELGRINANAISTNESVCITKIQNKWGVEDEQDKNAYLMYTKGSCAYYSFSDNQYVVYKIMQNGDIWVKYMTDKEPKEFRKWTTFYLCLFLLLSAPVWTTIFIEFDFLKLKPDYDAK